MIIYQQSFPGDTESGDLKADKDVVITVISRLPQDPGIVKAFAAPQPSLLTDTAGKTEPERQEQAERRIRRKDESIRVRE